MIEGLDGDIAMSPILETGSLSKMTVQDVPPLSDFRIPPAAVAT
jgi:hypothetical protein